MKLFCKNNKLYLIFKYDEEIITQVKELPAAKWDKEVKAWTFPATTVCYENIKEKFGIKIDELEGNFKLSIKNFEFKVKPYDHQFEAVKFALDNFLKYKGLNKGIAFLAEMGVGKSYMAISTVEILYINKLINNVLVISPLSIIDTWQEQLEKFCSYSIWDSLVGNKSKRLESLDRTYNYSKKFLNWCIINIDGISVIQEELKKKKFDLVIIDESTSIKNRQAQRTKLVTELFSDTPYKIIMSGNPIPKSADEIFSQYKFLDAGVFGSYYYSFIDRYCEVDYFNKVTELKNEQEFHSKMHSIAFRKTKQECLSLPPKIYEKEFIEMTPEQKQIYKTMEKDAIASYKDKTCAATVVITKFLRLSQIAGGFFPDNEGGGEYIQPNKKLERLVEIISELPKIEQFVVWARFRKEIEIIEKALKENNISCVTFYGETSYKDKGIARELFREKKVRGFIGNPSSGGKGLNDLIGATTVIYYSNDYSAENRIQSEDRNHRNGTIKVLYIDLIMKDTIDIIVLNTVRQNLDFANALLSKTLVL